MEVIDRLPRAGTFVFPGRTSSGAEVPISGFSSIKSETDRLIREAGPELRSWTFHDLRRTCRSGMSRLRISSEVAEAVLAHVIPGVRGIYDRHCYLAEKRDALERWSALLRDILDPSRKVVALRR